MSIKYDKRPSVHKTSSIARPSKIYPNLDFWFENKPSGNPAENRTSHIYVFFYFCLQTRKYVAPNWLRNYCSEINHQPPLSFFVKFLVLRRLVFVALEKYVFPSNRLNSVSLQSQIRIEMYIFSHLKKALIVSHGISEKSIMTSIQCMYLGKRWCKKFRNMHSSTRLSYMNVILWCTFVHSLLFESNAYIQKFGVKFFYLNSHFKDFRSEHRPWSKAANNINITDM
jgi:hypothetical protein